MYKKLSLSILLFSQMLIADENLNTNSLFEMSLEELMDIEITGSTKTYKNPLSVPSSVTVFTQKDINQLGVSTLEELKNYVAGFSSRRSYDNSITQNTVTRGYQSGEAGRDILIIIDGQRLNSNWNGGTSTFDANIALDNIQRVEFIRGASSSVYGSNAFSAIINLITMKDKNQLNIKASTTSVNTSALLSHGSDDLQVSAFIKGVVDDGNDYTGLKDTSKNGTTTAKDSYKSQNLYLQIKYKDLSIVASHKKNKVEDFYIIGYLDNDASRDILSDYLRMSYDYSQEKYTSQVAISYSYKSDKMRSVYLNPSLGNANADIVEVSTQMEWFNSYAFSSTQNIQFGAEFQSIDSKEAKSSYENFAYKETLFANLGVRNIYSLYFQYQAEFMKNFNFTAGVRYDKYSDFGDSVNPRLALVYGVTEDTSLKFLYSSAFRAPSKVELDTVNNQTIIGNPNLQAENINTYEMIFMHQFDTQALSLSLYRNEISNLIVKEALSGSTTASTYKNAQNATFDGIEIEYSALFFKSFSSRFAYSNVFNKPDNTFRNTSQMFSAILNYNYANANLNLSGYYHSDVQNDFNGVKEKLPSYAIVNSKLSYTINNDIQVYLHLKNLLNEDYYTPTDASSLTINLPSRGREVFLGCSYSF